MISFLPCFFFFHHLLWFQVDAWIVEELRHAPAGLSHGWFISNLKFYDLQDSLSGGTLVAMALSVAVAFSVMLLTTWNIIISLYAILSIAGTIFVTVGSLVLLGWELNVLESVTISVAVGLSVDFAVHYGVAYRLAPEPDREGKVVFSLSRMGSAIAMAALTTFVAGAMMMPSTVLAYTQLGTFMMLIMCISWAFATFFFQCMCRCVGPQGNCGQIPLPRKLRCPLFAQLTPAGKGSYGGGGAGGGGGEAERYELEPLASNRTAEGKAKEEPGEACTQLCNGALPGESQSEAGKASANNGVMPSPPLCCQYPQTANCTCGNPPPPPLHLHPDWGHHPCTQTPQDPPTPHLFPRSAAAAAGKHNAASAAANPDPACVHKDGHLRYAHCPPAHFHHCALGRLAAPRQGPTQSCPLRNHCSRAGSARPTDQNPDRTSGPGPADCQRQDTSSPDDGRNIEPHSLNRPDPSPAPDAPHTETQTDSSASPKKLSCFNRTLKPKHDSAPVPKAGVAPVAINARHSFESSC